MTRKNHPQSLIVGFYVVIAAFIIGASAVFYNISSIETYPTGTPVSTPNVSPTATPAATPTEAATQISVKDSEGDVDFTGEGYTGIVDLTYVKLDVHQQILNLTVTVEDSVPDHLRDGECAQWMATVVLLDDSAEAYQVIVEINSTLRQGELVGYSKVAGAEENKSCKVEHNENQMSISATLDGLQNATEIQWSVLAKYEKWAGTELVTSEFDTAPDEGIQTTILKK